MILVTGTSGFIGKHLLNGLVEKYGQDNIIALTSVPTPKCRYLLHKDYTFDKQLFTDSRLNGISVVIHAGAFIPKNAKEAEDTDRCTSNITSTLHLLNALPSSVEKIIFLSTVDVYDTAVITTEETAVIPRSLYGHSKHYCEKMLTAWAVRHNRQAILLRVGHVYGPGEEAYQKIIPVTIGKLLRGNAPQVFGKGEEKRAFMHVKDVVRSIIKAIDLVDQTGPINVASNQSVSIKELVLKLLKISGISQSIEFVVSDGTGRDLVFDNSRMQQFLAAESVELDEGLREEWDYMAGLNQQN